MQKPSQLLSLPPSFPVSAMPATNQGWPESFGFRISGSGPCYILWVQEGSRAALAGLRPGDEVLEIEGQPVSSLGSEALLGLARRCGNVPPSIGVVSRLQHASIPPGPRGCFGFELASESPPRVASVSPESPAAACGLEPGDYVLEVDGTPVALPEAAAALVGSCRGRALRLALLRPQRGDTAGDTRAGTARRDRRQKAQEFSRKVRPGCGMRGTPCAGWVGDSHFQPWHTDGECSRLGRGAGGQIWGMNTPEMGLVITWENRWVLQRDSLGMAPSSHSLALQERGETHRADRALLRAWMSLQSLSLSPRRHLSSYFVAKGENINAITSSLCS